MAARVSARPALGRFLGERDFPHRKLPAHPAEQLIPPAFRLSDPDSVGSLSLSDHALRHASVCSVPSESAEKRSGNYPAWCSVIATLHALSGLRFMCQF